MFQAAKEFRIGRPQIFAGLMLLAFLAQCLWVAARRRPSDLERQYIASGAHQEEAGLARRIHSPLTLWSTRLPDQAMRLVRSLAPDPITATLAMPHSWLLRLPFVVLGLWLGGALWWVARRLFDDAGGYVALALYCSSPAMVMISSNVGPEIILAWSIFGLMYTAIGVAHTLYAPPKKWVPRMVILGLAIGFALSAALWSFFLVLLAFAFMAYLAPGRQRSVILVLLGASAIGLAVLAFFTWATGGGLLSPRLFVAPKPTLALLRNLGFALSKDTDGYVLVAFVIAALTTYGTWPRARYFGNTAPLIAALAAVLLFALVPAMYLWEATLGLSFVFVFVGGVTADLLEIRRRYMIVAILAAGFLLRIILSLRTLSQWIGQKPV